MKNSLIITIIVAIVVGAAGFYSGMQYQKSQRIAGNFQFGQQAQTGTSGRRFGNGTGGNANGAPVVGKIVAQDDATITIQEQNGSQKIVDVSKNTTISKTSSGSAADLKIGDNIAAFGVNNSDGSITAQNIQINPMFRTGIRSGR